MLFIHYCTSSPVWESSVGSASGFSLLFSARLFWVFYRQGGGSVRDGVGGRVRDLVLCVTEINVENHTGEGSPI